MTITHLVYVNVGENCIVINRVLCIDVSWMTGKASRL